MSQSIGINHDRWTRTTVLTVACSIGLLISIPASATIVAGQVAGEDNLPRYWEIHAWLLSLGAALFVTTYLALWLKFLSRIKGIELPALATKISKMWYKMHVYFGAAGVILVIAGVILGYYMVDQAHGGQHLRLTHSYIGVLAGMIALAPLMSGLIARAAKKRRTVLRWWHLAIGMAGIVLMLAGAISGWALE